ncbi:ATP-dependent RecD-like DNA helicase [Granulicella sp. L60]|uniref:ATP-dependent DNA helicase n=1 Tax=Granulicella sp. L60 TaxID=1641866 RepID=UPI00131CBC86|nr:AAA family ATPase [Granulicella sp. L60]
MKDPDSNGGRAASTARRRRRQLAQEGPDFQGEFFAPPTVAAPAKVTAQPLATEVATPPAEIDVTPDPELTVDQAEALRSIEAAYEPGGFYLLTGHAGSGKTYLMQRLTKSMLAKNRRVVLSAPTHKAVAVLALKLTEANIKDVACRTIHSVLSLTPKPRTDRLVFERDRDAEPVKADVVVIDECSMVDLELFRHIKRHLPNAFVLFVGDPAQLPPVGEAESETFNTPNRSHLTTIVRQAAGNPILEAASIIRSSQGGPSDWSWLRQSALESGHGVFLPREAAHRWMRKAFTSEEFEADPNAFRYLAWTNRRVRQTNETIRRWRYGDNIPTPFMPGERALFRAPVIVEDSIIFANNEEAKVLGIEKTFLSHDIKEAAGVPKWTASIPTWLIRLEDNEGDEKAVHMISDESEFQKAVTRIKDEAAESRIRWMHLHEFQQSFARLQSIYSLTVHTSQGGTFGSVFIDLPDIRRREETNLLEAQQMLYVAATRPSKRLVVIEA